VYDALNVLISAGVLRKSEKRVECFENSFLVGNSFINYIREEVGNINKEIVHLFNLSNKKRQKSKSRCMRKKK